MKLCFVRLPLLAGIVLLLLVFHIIKPPDESYLQRLLLRIRTEDILAAMVGFYFGSKS